MKWVALATIAACAPTAAPRVELAPPPPPAPSIAAAPLRDPAFDSAAPIRVGAGGAWARAFRAEKNVSVLDARGGRVLLSWRIRAYRTVKPLPAEEDYPGNHVARLELVVRAEGAERVVPLGEMSGTPTPAAVTFCKNRGFHVDADGGWEFPKDPSVASAFTMAIVQGSDDYLLVRDGGTLHLLHRESSDGRCDESKQGPLDVCEGFEWARRAEIHVGGAELFETIDDDGKPFDCTAERWGERSVFP